MGDTARDDNGVWRDSASGLDLDKNKLVKFINLKINSAIV